MSRPTRIPERGDVAPSVVAQRLGMTPAGFQAALPELIGRGFPEPDPTTKNFCIEAVDRWRTAGRYGRLFPEMAACTALDANLVFEERMRRLGG